MTQRIRSAFQSWLAAFVALAFVSSWWIMNIFPTSDFWFEGHSMVIADVKEGEPVVLEVLREIHRPISGEWTTTVRRIERAGTSVYCSGQGVSHYELGAVYPKPLLLEWWAGEGCRDLPPGQYYVVTSWSFSPEWSVGHRMSKPLVSNVFTVWERADLARR